MSQQKSKGVKRRHGINDINFIPDQVVADGKVKNTNLNSIGDPGSVPPILFET